MAMVVDHDGNDLRMAMVKDSERTMLAMTIIGCGQQHYWAIVKNDNNG